MAGYSKRPLRDKLGIKAGMQLVLLHTPDSYADDLGPLPQPVRIHDRLIEHADFIHFFVRSQEVLRREFPLLKRHLSQGGMLWISWPKGTCAVVGTDLNENIIRATGLENGLVDVKVCAVDDTWSGLKFVYRLKDRSSL